MKMSKTLIIWVLLRFTLAFIMLWAFFDKVFGLGYATTPDKSWLQGVSPTTGFLKFGSQGIFANFFHSLAGNPLVDWLFMMGLLLIGTALLLGIGMRIAGYSGALLMFLLYLSLTPPENNPLIDEHIVYMLVFLGLSDGEAGKKYGLGNWWSKTKLVTNYMFLQ